MATRRKILKAAAVAPAIGAGALVPELKNTSTKNTLAPGAQQARELIGVPEPGGSPFSTAVRYNGTLFLSGQVGTAPDGSGLVPGGVEAEVRQTLENIRAALELSGSSLDRVLKVTVFLADIDDYATMNRVYREFFGDQPPARSTIAAAGLAIGAQCEIEAIAAA